MAIISELCGNWNGDKLLLAKMVDASAECGAAFAKIQTFYAKDLAQGWEQDVQRIKSLELTPDEHAMFVQYCRSRNIEPMTSIYSTEYLPMLSRAGFKWIKIGSAQCMDINLIKAAIVMGFKVIVSTGGHKIVNLPCVLRSVEAVLHCVSMYPHAHSQSGLGRMLELKGRYPTAAVGFSDHSDPEEGDGQLASTVAISMGAKYIERHFTLLPRNATKDGPVSITQIQLKRLCENFKNKDKVSLAKIFNHKQTESETCLIAKYKTRWQQPDCPLIVEG